MRSDYIRSDHWLLAISVCRLPIVFDIPSRWVDRLLPISIFDLHFVRNNVWAASFTSGVTGIGNRQLAIGNPQSLAHHYFTAQ
jgi:hypothetical protein